MDDRELILEYNGHLTFSTIGRLLTLLKHKVAEKNIRTGVYKRLISVMIETLENIYKYSDHYRNDAYINRNFTPRFMLDRINGTYFIHASNPIKNSDASRLRERIDFINEKSAEELKILYRQTITNGKFTSKGGAGLGIIEMAKISGNKLTYTIEPINGQFSRYSLTVMFNS